MGYDVTVSIADFDSACLGSNPSNPTKNIRATGKVPGRSPKPRRRRSIRLVRANT